MKAIAYLCLLMPVLGAPARQYVISTVAGNGGFFDPDATNAPATGYALASPLVVGVDQANRLLVGSGPRLLRLEAGRLVSIAGGPFFGTTGDGGEPRSASISNLATIAVTPTADIYLNEQFTPKIRRISGNRIESILDRGRISNFAGSTGMAIDSAGRLILININRLVRYDGRTFTDLSPYVFSSPKAIAIGPSGMIYVANQGTDQIIQVAPNGTASVLAGSGVSGFAGDNGPARSAQLNDPSGLAVDGDGTVYFTDERNNRVRAITPDGFILTIAGSGTEGFAGDGGNALAASFNHPQDLAIDAFGNLYVADLGNLRVRKVAPDVPPVVLQGASGDPRLAPGSLFSLYGHELASTTEIAGTTPWPTTLAGAFISINGVAAPLYYVSPGQINGQVPYETAVGNATATIGGTSVSFPVIAANPGILVYAGDHAVLVNPNGTVNAPSSSARPGDIVIVYFTGMGRPDVPVKTGEAAPATEPLARSAYPYQITVAGTPATVSYLGLAPGFPALCQANFAVPDVPTGEQPLVITVNGQASKTARISVAAK